MSARKTTQSSATSDKTTESFTDAERSAMKERARETRAEARRSSKADKAAEALRDLLAKIEDMPDPERAMAARVHEIVTSAAPGLVPKTWYGMPAYANADGKVLCFFKPASKFGARYATLGFTDVAALDDGNLWPTEFALVRLTDAEEARIAALVTQAVS